MRPFARVDALVADHQALVLGLVLAQGAPDCGVLGASLRGKGRVLWSCGEEDASLGGLWNAATQVQKCPVLDANVRPALATFVRASKKGAAGVGTLLAIEKYAEVIFLSSTISHESADPK